ncbi:MAG TPA: ATP-binding protein [Lacunisphaera sp.]|jgi:signal transduction histidine kinase/ActR/RegA family two-component response regulator
MNPGAGIGRNEGNPPLKSIVERAMADGIQQIAPHGIFTTDPDLRIVSWNQWLATHSGRPAESVVGQLLIDVFPELSQRRLFDRYLRVLAGEISVLSTALHKHLLAFPATVPESDHPHMLQTARIAPLRDGEKIVGTITIIEDVSQREYQSGILRKQQEMDRLLSAALAVLLQSSDPVNEMGGIFANIILPLGLDAFICHVLNADRTSLTLKASSGISAGQREMIASLPVSEKELLRDKPANGAPEPVIASYAEAIRRFGFSTAATFPLVADDELIGIVTFASYQRRSIPAADTKTLARIARYVGIALERAIRERDTVVASRAKDDFLAALSHELRTPLNPVLLVSSDAVQNTSYPPEAREAFRVIEKNALLEARLIDDLLDITRIERGKLSLEMQSLDVHVVLSDALEAVRPDVTDHRLSLHLSLHAEQSIVKGDSARLQQVFWNIIKNAVKFTPASGEIWLTSAVDEASGQIIVKIRDTGIGMNDDEVARIFGAFSQGDHAIHGRSHQFGGLGLGLAISRKIVDLHGGSLEAASEGKGRGAQFTLRLPLASALQPAKPAAIAGERTDSAPPMEFASTASRLGILLVEDHEPTRKSLAFLLQRRGYDVVSAATASAALQQAARRSFNLVLSDIGLPDEDGFELMKKLRDQYGLKGIALTGYGMEEDIHRSTGAGFFAHLTKPINANVLDRALAQAFSASPFPGDDLRS